MSRTQFFVARSRSRSREAARGWARARARLRRRMSDSLTDVAVPSGNAAIGARSSPAGVPVPADS